MFFRSKAKTPVEPEVPDKAQEMKSEAARTWFSLANNSSPLNGASQANGLEAGHMSNGRPPSHVDSLVNMVGAAPVQAKAELEAETQVASPAPATRDRQPPPTDEERQKSIEHARHFALALGQVASVAMNSKQHQAMRLAEFRVRAVPAVLNGQFALASRRDEKSGLQRPVTALLWASVSDEVDRRLSCGDGGEIKLERSEWRSGPHVWLVDVFGDQGTLPGLLRQLSETQWQGRPVKMFVRDADGRAHIRILGAPLGREVQ
ncbi:MAG: toxin-activating lysine-acyltransferase [Hyphomicrobium sp.]